MSLIDTVPTVPTTVPSFLRDKPNGQLDPSWLRDFDGDGKLFEPVSYCMQALHIAAWGDQTTGFGYPRIHIDAESVGRYRTCQQQHVLWPQRWTTTPTPGRPTRSCMGKTWWLKPGSAAAACPCTSNHGKGIADDVAYEVGDDDGAESMPDVQLAWMRDFAPGFGFQLETRSERWHWGWTGGDRIPQRVVDVLFVCGITIPDMSRYAFTVPAPTPGLTPGGTVPPPTPIGTSYTVKAGDGWIKVAAALGASIADVQAANGMSSTTVLHPGMVIRAPRPVPPPVNPDSLPTPVGDKAMKPGASDASTVIPGVANEGRVTWLQAIIGVPQTGQYDDATVAKIMELQHIGGLAEDGQYGPQTEATFRGWRGK